jgi:ADP-ribose pyrophosphatase YjhB (NUDIX family)
MNKIVVTGILVKNDEGKVLLVKKPDGVGPYAGTFLTPGGGVKTGESADEAVQRELYEETGVKAINIKRVLFDDDVTENWKGEKTHFIMLLYTGEYVSGDLKPTENNDDNLEVMKWFSPSELVGVPLSPPLQKLLAVIGTWKNKFIFHSGLYVSTKS